MLIYSIANTYKTLRLPLTKAKSTSTTTGLISISCGNRVISTYHDLGGWGTIHTVPNPAIGYR